MDARGQKTHPSKRSPPPNDSPAGDAEKYKQQRAIVEEESPGGTLTETSRAVPLQRSYSHLPAFVQDDMIDVSMGRATPVVAPTPPISSDNISPGLEGSTLSTLRPAHTRGSLASITAAALETAALTPSELEGSHNSLDATSEAVPFRRHGKTNAIFPEESRHGTRKTEHVDTYTSDY